MAPLTVTFAYAWVSQKMPDFDCVRAFKCHGCLDEWSPNRWHPGCVVPVMTCATAASR